MPQMNRGQHHNVDLMGVVQNTPGHDMPGHTMPGHDMPGHDMPDHGGHGGHGGSDDQCTMNMIFTWDWKNTCVVFRWWHIRTFTDFVLTIIAIISLTAGYEWLKARVVAWDERTRSNVVGLSSASVKKYKITRGVLYGLQVAFSFWLMLVFMTYNGWLMIAVAVGAALGNYLWGNSSDHTLACH